MWQTKKGFLLTAAIGGNKIQINFTLKANAAAFKRLFLCIYKKWRKPASAVLQTALSYYKHLQCEKETSRVIIKQLPAATKNMICVQGWCPHQPSLIHQRSSIMACKPNLIF